MKQFKFRCFASCYTKERLRRILYVSLAMNALALAVLCVLAVVSLAKLESIRDGHVSRLGAMDATFRRCAVGIRFVERYSDRGKVLVFDKEVVKQIYPEVAPLEVLPLTDLIKEMDDASREPDSAQRRGRRR